MDEELISGTVSAEELYEIISHVHDKWKNIGLKLGLYPTTLEDIDKLHDGKTDKCLHSVLDYWLHRRDNVLMKGGVTWKVLIYTLKHVGSDDAAALLKREAETKLNAAKKIKHKQLQSDDAPKLPENARPELRDLVRLEVAPEWYSLGLQLKITEDALNIIETDHGHNSSTCRRKMFSKWLTSNTDASYADLVDALIVIKKNDIAESVSNKFLGKSIRSCVTPIDQSNKIDQATKSREFPKSSKLLQHLLFQYRTTIKDDAEWPPTVHVEYINLALITNKERFYTLEAVKSKMKSSNQVNVQHILEQNESIPFVDLLNYDADKKVVLIEGPAGVGKSTLASKLCTEWAKGNLKEYSLVMCFPLRAPLVRLAESTEDLLRYFDDACSDEDIKYIKETQGSKVLLILDGWDELGLACRAEHMFFPKLIKGKILPGCSIVITSRSGPTDFIKYKAPNPRLIEVLGFTQEQIEDYIRRYFKGDSEAGEKLLKDLVLYPNVANACYIAINLIIVCYVYCVNNYKLPPTLTEVYETFIVHAVIRYLKKLEVIMKKRIPELNQIDGIHSLSDPIKTTLKNLGQLALEGISNDNLCFPERQLFDLCKPDENMSFDGYGLLKMMRISRMYRLEISYHFLHLTIQEWLAAHYLSHLTEKDIIIWLEKNHQNPKYTVVIQFFCGINRFQSSLLCQFMPNIKIDLAVCRWVFEGQWEKGCEKIATQMSDFFTVGTPTDRQTLQPYDSMVLLFVLKHSNTLWKLMFTNIQLTNHVLIKMCEEFISLPMLLYDLTVEKTTIQHDTAVMLGNIVQSQNKLTSLTLTQTDLNDDALSALCDALVGHRALENFNVNENKLTVAGALFLSSLLPKLVALKQLNVSDNNIGVKGCNYIIHAVNEMEKCPLQVLELSIAHTDFSMLHSLINKDIKLVYSSFV